MNFDLAAGAAAQRGHRRASTSLVTDDIASAPPERDDEATRHRRRLRRSSRCAGAAAEDGLRPRRGRARRPTRPTTAPAPSASRSPAAPCPARTSRCSPCPRAGWGSGWASTASRASPTSRMPPAAELARILVDGVLAEAARRRLAAGSRVILNGLGAHEVRGAVRRLGHGRRGCCATPATRSSSPRSASWSPASTWPGCSLTLIWLDDELERFWTAPADTPAYRKGDAAADSVRRAPTRAAESPRARTARDAGLDAVRRARPPRRRDRGAAMARWPRCCRRGGRAGPDGRRRRRRRPRAGHGQGGRRARPRRPRPPLEAGAGVRDGAGRGRRGLGRQGGGTSGVLWGAAAARARCAPR